MRTLLIATLLAAATLSPVLHAQATYSTSFEAPSFAPGDVRGQDGWDHISNSPTRGAIEAIPRRLAPALGAQALALRTRNVDFFGVQNHLASATIDPPAGETGASHGGAPLATTRDSFLATFWYRTPDAPVISTRADGRYAELNPSVRAPGADQPANRYAQVRLVNNTNSAAGLVRVEAGWYTTTATFNVATVADNLAWGSWYRFEYAIRTLDGLDGAAPNDLFTLRIFDQNDVLLSSTAAATCAATWEAPYRTGQFGGSATPRALNGFDFWSQTGPNDTLVGHIDGFALSTSSEPDPLLQLASGDGQSGNINTTLPQPLTVSVAGAIADHARCHPIAFAATGAPAGATGHSVGAASVQPDPITGNAATTATLGDLGGTYTYQASSPRLAGSPVTFTATAIAPAPAISLTKTLTSQPVFIVEGSTLGYTVTANNSGNVALDAVVVADPLLTPDSANCATLAIGADCVLAGSYTVTASDVANGGITNTASVQSQQTQSQQVTLLTPIPRADLSITKDDGGVDFIPGGTIGYTLTIGNAGPDAAQQLEVVDTLPAGTTFVAAVGAGWACTHDAGTVRCTRPTLANGASATIALDVAVDPAYSGATIVNSASVTNVVADPSANNNAASDTTGAIQGGGPADLQLTKTSTTPTVTAGDPITYTLTVRNVGVATAVASVLADPTPPGLVFLDASAPCSGGFPCNLGDLANNTSVVVTARYTVPATYSGATATNVATVNASSQDPTPADNTASATTTIVPAQQPLPTIVPVVVPTNDRWSLLLVAVMLALFAAMTLRTRR